MRLILVRHGESWHSSDGLISSRIGCRGLTECGREQAQLLAARWKRTSEVNGCAALLSSPTQRAKETADILLQHAFTDRREEDSALTEIDAGIADGCSWESYRATYKAFDLIAEPDRPFAPGGESWRQFTNRVQVTMTHLADRFAGESVVAVTHAGFIVVALLTLFAIPRPGTNTRFDPRHTSLTEWRCVDGVWHLERYNDIAHLLG